MKTKFLVFTLCCMGVSAHLQAQTEVPKYYELKGQAYIQADSILDTWMKTQYPVILKKNKLKMTCAHCTNIFMDVIVGIDENGRLYGITVVETVKCADEFSEKLKNEFLSYFTQLVFPPSLRNLEFQYRLGTGLKC